MLTVESGAIVENANSYVSVADFRAYATARGVSLSADDADVEVILIKAMDFLESHSSRFKGRKVSRDQALSWPRYDVVIEDWSWSHTEIPRQVIAAQCALGIEIAAGEDPFNPPAADQPVVREKVDVVEVEYAGPSRISKVSKEAPSQTIINLLLRNSGLFLVRA